MSNTYRAGTAALLVAAAGTGLFFVIEGSATKRIVVRRLTLTCPTLTAVAFHTVQAIKYSTAAASGTETALTKILVSGAVGTATANKVQVYTAAPTAGTPVGVVASRRFMSVATVAVDTTVWTGVEIVFPSGVPLDGVASGLGLNFLAAPATAVSMALDVEWEELG